MRRFLIAFTFFLMFLFGAEAVWSQMTEFTYQGSLATSGSPANGNYDFEFILYDAASGGAQVGSTIALNNVVVANGVFSVKLNFGNQFTGANRFLEIRLRPSGQSGMTILSPRQLINSAPYAVKSLSAENAMNTLSLGGIGASQYVLTSDPRMTDARPPTAGSPSYIQNGTTPQASSNFNISGTGTAAIFDTATQYNVGGLRILSSPSIRNLVVGTGAGAALDTSQAFDNIFVGFSAGRATTKGDNNLFFGNNAGLLNVFGSGNVYIGSSAGRNTTSVGNVFVGWSSGELNTNGPFNTFLGHTAGENNTTGSYNIAVGQGAGFNSGDLDHATVIGAGSRAGSSNSITLGRAMGEDLVRIPGNLVLTTLSTGGVTAICRNAFLLIATCSSSARYKSNIAPFGSGIALVRRLRPVSFNWKEGGMLDIGLVAEEVNKVEPLLTAMNDNGEVEGVKYDRLNVVLINAVKDQQKQIESLKSQLSALTSIVCSQQPKAKVCRRKSRR